MSNRFKNSSVTKVAKKDIEKKQDNNFSLTEVRQIQQISETIISNQVNEMLGALTDSEIEIARDVANGELNSDILIKYGISTNQLTKIKQKPSFLQEVTKIQFSETFSNDNVRLQAQNNVMGKLMQSIGNIDFSEISPSDQIKLFTALSANISKDTKKENENKKVDITLIMKEIGISESLKQDKNGMKYIETQYPVINNETGEIESYDK